ncbi:hypothetical protein MMZ06_27770 [Burkholderia gladioli]|uniref:plasmid mobilization protein n=1 Tax=Burkholderia gladioli TaxID=28095 RepID=UPI0016403570|nr:hypothetical protein [Burkholderia gladioli]MBJ9711896.1 hypothetical protein [Burkholderia gladioli]MCH7273628.1 hypothetical protein [Burkholderia gladioli]MDZ4041612.1 hypothetical protein [Burkholderia gladioli pv. alliicola]
MPRLKTPGKGASKPISFKLDPESERFYRRKAQESGLSLSDYIRKQLAQGVITENVSLIEQRLRGLIDLLAGQASAAGAQVNARTMLPAEIVRATFFSQEVLKAIASNQNKQTYYAAQEAAEEETKKLLGAAHV